jgi:hypothetical protein
MFYSYNAIIKIMTAAKNGREKAAAEPGKLA